MNNKNYKGPNDYDVVDRINDEPKTYKTGVVGTTLTHHELVETDIVFDPPKHDEVLDIISVNNSGEILNAEVKHDDFVFIKGYIQKTITYSTAKKPEVDKLNEFKNLYQDEYMDDNEECEGKSSLCRGPEGKDEKDKDGKDKDGKDKDGKDKDEKDKDGKGKDEKDKDGKDKDEKDKDEKDKDGKHRKDDLKPVKVDGVIRHSTILIPFEFSIHMDGAREEDIPTATFGFAKTSEGNSVLKEKHRIKGISESDVVKIIVTLNKI